MADTEKDRFPASKPLERELQSKQNQKDVPYTPDKVPSLPLHHTVSNIEQYQELKEQEGKMAEKRVCMCAQALSSFLPNLVVTDKDKGKKKTHNHLDQQQQPSMGCGPAFLWSAGTQEKDRKRSRRCCCSDDPPAPRHLWLCFLLLQPWGDFGLAA